MRGFLSICFIFLGNVLLAQEAGMPWQTRYTVSASVNVIDNVSLFTIRDINLLDPASVEGVINVPPVTSMYAGMMRINARPGKQVRITYLTSETLVEENGSGGVIKATYRISGFEADNQSASVLLDIGEANVRIGKEGQYFLWLGAQLDITKATPGQYVSEFIIELEGN